MFKFVESHEPVKSATRRFFIQNSHGNRVFEVQLYPSNRVALRKYGAGIGMFEEDFHNYADECDYHVFSSFIGEACKLIEMPNRNVSDFFHNVRNMILKIDMQKELENLQKEEANTKKKI